MSMDNFDPLLLSRIQFAFTIAFHIIFPAFTIGLASWLVILETFYLKTKHPVYIEVYKFWVKIFAVTFGMGVVSGVVMSYQIGTNWSSFSDKVGSVIGPLMGFEIMTAFFLEASFLGIMLFGWQKVTPKMHFISTIAVAFGTLLSAFWIISANSWMHTPQGFEIAENGTYRPTDWFQIIFNPSFPFRFLHMTMAAYLTTAFTVGGVAAWYLFKNKYIRHARVMFAMAMFMAMCATPFQIILGDLHGLNTYKHQPLKVAAMEGAWETEKGAPLRLIGLPDEMNETIKYSLEIPKLGSLILTHDLNGEIKGIKAWPKEERPPVKIVFFAFRIMVAIGFLMAFTGFLALILTLRHKLFTSSWFHLWCMALTPCGFIAVISGWIVTECGRQPYLVYNVLRTADALSPIQGSQVAFSLVTFIIVYFFIFGAGSYYILKLISKGPQVGDWEETYGTHGLKKLVSFADVLPRSLGGK